MRVQNGSQKTPRRPPDCSLFPDTAPQPPDPRKQPKPEPELWRTFQDKKIENDLKLSFKDLSKAFRRLF